MSSESIIEDLNKIPDYRQSQGTQECSESLISKYKIPIQHFEFDYVQQCSDGRELEKILQVLRSGEEGWYPDLIKCTEERLRLIKPRSRYLRKACPVLNKEDLKKEEVEELSNDLEKFVSTVTKKDKELESRKSNKQYCDVDVRKGKTQLTEEDKKEKRIQSTDYSSWDKYDPDTEILKMDLEEEKQKKQALEEREMQENHKFKRKKSVTFNQFATEAEAVFFSEREREKGNEFFKAGDFTEALSCYTTSIQSKASVNNLNNRAATYLKLKRYEDAIRDCNQVLLLDKKNLKASHRKAEALEKLKRFEEALEAIELVIEQDPNNTGAQALAERVREKCFKDVKNTRLKIVEIED